MLDKKLQISLKKSLDKFRKETKDSVNKNAINFSDYTSFIRKELIENPNMDCDKEGKELFAKYIKQKK